MAGPLGHTGRVTQHIDEVLGVYDADGGLAGELAYVAGKLLGRTHCSLCDITHSPVRRKRTWDAAVAGSPVPVRLAHRNELATDEREALAGSRLPAVLGRSADGWRVLLDAASLDAMDGSVTAFWAALRPLLRR